ncbi:MAG: phage holin family protein [Janthinobacterium lividum]
MRLLLNFLAAITSGKTLPAILLGLAFTPVLALVERYLFNDWNFLSSLGMLILVDTVFGVQHHWAAHSIGSRGFSRLFKKVGIYLGLLVLTHQLTGYQVHGEVNGIFSSWVDKFMYACMMAREALSILEHVAALEPRLVPKVLLKRLALISDGDFSALAAPLPAPASEADAPPSSPSNAQ